MRNAGLLSACLLSAGLPAGGQAGLGPPPEETVEYWVELGRTDKHRFIAELSRRQIANELRSNPSYDLEIAAALDTGAPGATRGLFSAPYATPSFLLDVNLDGAIDQRDVDAVRTRPRFPLTHPSYDPALDFLAHAFMPGPGGYPVRAITQEMVDESVRVISDRIPALAAQQFEDRRPLVGAAFYAWYDTRNPVSWGLAQDVPLPGLYGVTAPYDSSDPRVAVQQRDLAHLAGIDFFAVSSLQLRTYLEAIREDARRNPEKHRFLVLLEHTFELPIEVRDGLPFTNFDRPEVRSVFFNVLDRHVGTIEEVVGRDTVLLIDGRVPFWVWAGQVFEGDVAGAVLEYNRSRAIDIALLGSEQPNLPPNLLNPGERDRQIYERARAWARVIPYGNYVPEHVRDIGRGQLNELLRHRTLTGTDILAKGYRRNVATIYDGLPPEVDESFQFSYKDNRGNPVLASAPHQRRAFLQEQYRRNVVGRRVSIVMGATFNEFREGTQIEPDAQTGFVSLYEIKRVYGPSFYAREHLASIGPIVIAVAPSGAARGRRSPAISRLPVGTQRVSVRGLYAELDQGTRSRRSR